MDRSLFFSSYLPNNRKIIDICIVYITFGWRVCFGDNARNGLFFVSLNIHFFLIVSVCYTNISVKMWQCLSQPIMVLGQMPGIWLYLSFTKLNGRLTLYYRWWIMFSTDDTYFIFFPPSPLLTLKAYLACPMTE